MSSKSLPTCIVITVLLMSALFLPAAQPRGFRILGQNHWPCCITPFWIYENHWLLRALAWWFWQVPDTSSRGIHQKISWQMMICRRKKFDDNSFSPMIVLDWCVGNWLLTKTIATKQQHLTLSWTTHPEYIISLHHWCCCDYDWLMSKCFLSSRP